MGLYANTLMFMPEEEVHTPFESEGQGAQKLDATVAAQLKRRRIHLPPATSEDQRRRIMDVLARIQPFFGSTLEDAIQAERSHLPAGATIVVITSSVTDHLLDSLAHLKQSGHAVTLLFVGDNPSPARLAGLTVYHIGGTEAWRQLEAAYSTTDGKEARQENASVDLRL